MVQGKPSAEIIRYAAENAVDMIVLGTHGKGMLDQALFGSTTERVVRRAPCPVLTVRKSGARVRRLRLVPVHPGPAQQHGADREARADRREQHQVALA